MRVKPGILLIMGLLFLAGTVAAVGIPDTLTVTTDKPWIIANNLDQATITVKVTNTTSDPGPVQGVIVNLEVDPLYGNISPITSHHKYIGNGFKHLQSKAQRVVQHK